MTFCTSGSNADRSSSLAINWSMILFSDESGSPPPCLPPPPPPPPPPPDCPSTEIATSPVTSIITTRATFLAFTTFASEERQTSGGTNPSIRRTYQNPLRFTPNQPKTTKTTRQATPPTLRQYY